MPPDGDDRLRLCFRRRPAHGAGLCTALAGWTYIVAWRLLHAVGLGDARAIVGAAVGALVAAEVMRVH